MGITKREKKIREIMARKKSRIRLRKWLYIGFVFVGMFSMIISVVPYRTDFLSLRYFLYPGIIALLGIFTTLTANQTEFSRSSVWQAANMGKRFMSSQIVITQRSYRRDYFVRVLYASTTASTTRASCSFVNPL